MASIATHIDRSFFYLDSGATVHIVHNIQSLSNFRLFTNERIVYMGNGIPIKALGCGTVHISAQLILQNVWYCPTIEINLVSTDQLNYAGYNVHLEAPGNVRITAYRSATIIATAQRYNGLRKIDIPSLPRAVATAPNSRHVAAPAVQLLLPQLEPPQIDGSVDRSTDRSTDQAPDPVTDPVPTTMTSLVQQWHERLGHISDKRVRKLLAKLNISVVNDRWSSKDCIACLHGKQHLVIDRTPQQRATRRLELIHSDTSGRLTVSREG